MDWKEEIASALRAAEESACVDFKESFDPSQKREWLELLKDIVAMANSGGGVILVGVSDNGRVSAVDATPILDIDPADFVNKINKYTGVQFEGVRRYQYPMQGNNAVVISVGRSSVPIVFTSTGNYDLGNGKQGCAFSVGTVYFRHGAKSEPCISADLRAFVDREVEALRRTWLDGIAKVVKAPAGSRFQVITDAGDRERPVGLTSDPGAPRYYLASVDETHPFRTKELVIEVNRRLAGRVSVNSHDILCVRSAHEVDANLDFCYRQSHYQNRYSLTFVDWLVAAFEADDTFFLKCREHYSQQRKRRSSG